MRDIDYFEGVRIRALLAVMEPDDHALIRRICRWYSQEFSTPLRVVEDELGLDHVLTHWFESEYEKMDPDDRHNLGIYLLETPEERKLRDRSDKAMEDKLIQDALAKNAKHTKKQSAAQAAFERMKAKAKSGKKLEEQLDLPDNLRDLPNLKTKAMPETKVTSGPVKEPDEVKIQYMSTGDFEAELDMMPGPQPKPRKKA